MAIQQRQGDMRFQWPAGSAAKASESDGSPEGGPQSTASAAFHSTVWWGFYLAAWCIVVSLAAVAGLRIFKFDANHALACINSFTRYVYLPAYACVAWAVWQRRWLLAAVATVIVACHVTWMVPDFVRDRRFDPPSTLSTANASPTLRVFFANVNGDNTEHQALFDEIAAANPDVVVLVEFSWPWHVAVKTSPVMAPYKYGAGWLQSHIGSVNMFSKLPLTTEQQDWIVGRPMHTVEIKLGSQTLTLIGLHAPRPIGLPSYGYDEYWQEMLPKLKSEAGPLMIVGDFNSTEHSRVYRELTADRLRSAHQDRGRGWATTWPNGKFRFPPIRIDQAFLSPDVECVRIAEGVGRGSDHKPLIVDVRIRDSSKAPAASMGE